MEFYIATIIEAVRTRPVGFLDRSAGTLKEQLHTDWTTAENKREAIGIISERYQTDNNYLKIKLTNIELNELKKVIENEDS